MNSRWLLGIVEKFTGRVADHIYMAGGGALSDIWPQIYADVLGRKILVVDNPRYSTVRGIALLSAVGSGYNNMESIAILKKTSREYMPDIKNVEIYKTLYNEFIKYYHNNHKSMRSLNMKQTSLNQA
jgi:sugar (pentulose or hexulose) kinase